MTVFETTTCTRCGGSGKFSFNLMHGDTCYGCAGTGKKLTKRGAAAREFFIKSQQMPVADLKVGMFLWDDTYGKRAKFLPVLEIKPSTSYSIVNGERQYGTTITTQRGGLTVHNEATVRAVRDEEHRKALLDAALAYEASLTKAGKPAKPAKKATVTWRHDAPVNPFFAGAEPAKMGEDY